MLTLRKNWLEREVIEAIIEHSTSPETKRLIEEELPRIVATSEDGDKARVQTMERELEQLLKQRKRLVDAIAQGTLAEREAATTLVELRARIAGIETELERVKFAVRRAPIGEELKRAKALATDYQGQIRKLTGQSLRRVVEPWIADAKVDKEQRVLILTLWALPGIRSVLRLGDSRALDTQDKVFKRLTTRRRIKLPPSPSRFLTWYNRNRPRAQA